MLSTLSLSCSWGRVLVSAEVFNAFYVYVFIYEIRDWGMYPLLCEWDAYYFTLEWVYQRSYLPRQGSTIYRTPRREWDYPRAPTRPYTTLLQVMSSPCRTSACPLSSPNPLRVRPRFCDGPWARVFCGGMASGGLFLVVVYCVRLLITYCGGRYYGGGTYTRRFLSQCLLLRCRTKTCRRRGGHRVGGVPYVTTKR